MSYTLPERVWWHFPCRSKTFGILLTCPYLSMSFPKIFTIRMLSHSDKVNCTLVKLFIGAEMMTWFYMEHFWMTAYQNMAGNYCWHFYATKPVFLVWHLDLGQNFNQTMILYKGNFPEDFSLKRGMMFLVTLDMCFSTWKE